ncbi:Three-deoxy-D-manno-octulosonic-acid transferase domain protein [Thermocrinis albus DSM 14484]|uniref:3-deoxy-D-manno-octulosonic acid transferase n=1 Tax=Thermocrinis albus (strain DSM 14484 / JCM 11386 / HI 11/12) TaxID=638303 RepID=D3SMX1_THEAH|nr:glycosyltransferase N-terminal domain-containing protein [Thermocrinis albus]ADC90101.1 Three-deoxy-D-manno-octulosonic-acid transferase domain protein [Thermocrinis albus DSM 14484]
MSGSVEESTLWFHCASVGEFNTAKPILKELVRRYKVVLTYFSPRAKSYLESQKDYYHQLRRLPVDLPWTVRRLEESIKPKAIVVVEREFWPCFLTFTRSKKILINAYAKGGFWERLMAKKFHLVLCRTDQDTEIYTSYGVRALTCGNLKLVMEKEDREVLLQLPEGRIWVAGSLHPEEFSIIASAFRILREEMKDLRLIAVPRHVSQAEKLLTFFRGFRVVLRTQHSSKDWDVMVVDTLGELRGLYRYGHVAFVGGTFCKKGGHNLLEPVYAGVPVVFGPYTQKVKDLEDFLVTEGAGFKVRSLHELIHTLRALLTGSMTFRIPNMSSLAEEIRSCYLSQLM